VVRGVSEIPPGCKQIIDSQYTKPFALDLPFNVPGGALPVRASNEPPSTPTMSRMFMLNTARNKKL
jgi:hypothetical protein